MNSPSHSHYSTSTITHDRPEGDHERYPNPTEKSTTKWRDPVYDSETAVAGPSSLSSSSTGIPIPRMPSASYPAEGTNIGGRTVSTSGYASTSQYPPSHPSSTRSPSGSSSLSSHRSHPYPRRPSYPRQPSPDRDSARGNDSLPRIQLPPPGSSAPFKFESNDWERESQHHHHHRNVPPLTSLNISPSGGRPVPHRSTSSSSSGRAGGMSLPPLHSISGEDSHRPTTGGPGLGTSPPGHHAPAPYHLVPGVSYSPNFHATGASIHGVSDSPGVSSRKTSPSLRPGYTYDHYSQPTATSPQDYDRPPPTPDHHYLPASMSHHPGPSRYPPPHQKDPYAYGLPPQHHHAPPQPPHSRPSSHGYAEPQSPPLRSLPPDYRSTSSHAHQGFHAPSTGYRVSSGRSRSHSTASARAPLAEPVEAVAGTGNNRRLAHLMSEQKRRESINTGFAALRNAIPASIPTDSKAIILRKAVNHIAHLENLLRRAGINPSSGTGSASGPVLTPSSWDEDERGEVEGSVIGRGEGREEREGDGDDVDMDEEQGRREYEESRRHDPRYSHPRQERQESG